MRAWARSRSNGEALLKIDFKNAFNSLSRKFMLLAVKEFMPDLLPFSMFCYADHTPLRYQQHEISSQRGVQQGDALGPLLFCLALRKITSSINHHCSFVRNYMDDVTACGDIESLESFFAQLATASADAGLQINESKCELWGENILIPDSSALEKLPIAEWSEGIILLGSPIGSDAFAL